SSWPWVTVSPTCTAIEATVPPVTKSAVAVWALWTEPVAETVALTSPWVTGTVREAPVGVVLVVSAVAVTRWYAYRAPTSATTPSPVLSHRPRRAARTRAPETDAGRRDRSDAAH